MSLKKPVKSKIGIHIRVHVITVDLMEMVHIQVLKTTTKTLGKSKLWKLKVDFKENKKSIGYIQIKIGSHRSACGYSCCNENRYLKGTCESLNK